MNDYHYLISDETKLPDWYPAPLFEIIDTQLPSIWHYDYLGNEPDSQVQGIWGYYELVVNKGRHYSALMARDSDALATFEKRRSEIDAETNGNPLARRM